MLEVTENKETAVSKPASGIQRYRARSCIAYLDNPSPQIRMFFALCGDVAEWLKAAVC